MHRHPGLRNLSREHHHALVLARALQGAAKRADWAGLLDEAHRRWKEEIAPHFSVEERELIPLSVCGGESLHEQGERIRSEHAELRQRFDQLCLRNLASQGPELGRLLAAHIRFEERCWFPALEAFLDSGTLRALTWRLQKNPESVIEGFRLEEDGAWVVMLDCGHSRHIRHQPPFHRAPWLLSEQGRAARLGTRVACQLCHMPRMPTCCEPYRRTPRFGEQSTPAGLLRSHQLRAETWARIIVEEGRVHYVLEDDGGRTLVLRPGVIGVVAPERPHHVQPQRGAQFCVEFCRCRR